MRSNPPHLSVIYADNGVDIISDFPPLILDPPDNPPSITRPPLSLPAEELQDLSQLSQPVQTGTVKGGTEMKGHFDYENGLYFSLNNEGTLCPTLMNLNMDEQLSPITEWVGNCLDNIKGTYQDFPIRTATQAQLAHTDLENLKVLSRSIDDIPSSLKDLVPEKNQNKIEDILNEDLLTLTSFCYKRMKKMRSNLINYEGALRKLTMRKITRKTGLILQGKEPVPLELLEEQALNQTSNYEDHYSTIQEIKGNQQLQISVELPSIVSPDSETNTINDNSQGLLMITNTIEPSPIITNSSLQSDNIVQDVEHDLANLTICTTSPNHYRAKSDHLETIPEERDPLTTKEKELLTSLTREILGNDSFDGLDINNPPDAIKLLQEKLGITINIFDPNLIDTLNQLNESKKMFKNLLNMQPISNKLTSPSLIQEPTPLSPKPLPAMPESLNQASYQLQQFNETNLLMPSNKVREIQSTPTPELNPPNTPTSLDDSVYNFYTPSTPNMLLYHSLYQTAPSTANASMSNNQISDIQTPKLTGILKPKNLNRTIIGQETSDCHVKGQMPLGIGPNLQSDTTLEDLQRHQRGYNDPPVRNKEQKCITKVNSIDQEYLGTLPLEEQKQYLGDHIFPLIQKTQPFLAKKITGMLLDLPNAEIIRAITIQQILDKWISDAISTLSDYEHMQNTSPEEKTIDPGYTQPKDAANKYTKDAHIPMETKPVFDASNKSNPNNDHHTAMFQEVAGSTNKNNSSRHLMVNQHIPFTSSNVGGQLNPLLPTIKNTSKNNYQAHVDTTTYKSIPSSNASMVYMPMDNTQPPKGIPFSNNGHLISSKNTAYKPTLQTNSTIPCHTYSHQHVPNQTLFGTLHDNQMPCTPNYTVPLMVHPRTRGAFKEFTTPILSPMHNANQTPVSMYMTTDTKYQPRYASNASTQNINTGAYRPQGMLPNQHNLSHNMDQMNTTNVSWTTPYNHPATPLHPGIMNQSPQYTNTGHPAYGFQAQMQHNIHATIPQTLPSNYQSAYGQAYTPRGQASPTSNARPQHQTPHNRNNSNNPAIIELVLRERKELCSTSFLIQRIVGQLKQASQMNSQELTDLLGNMKEFGRSLEKLENKVSKFLKYLIENKSIIDQYDSGLYQDMKNEIDEAEHLSSIFQQGLNDADQIIRSEKITISQMSSNDSKELPYKEFNAGRSMHDAHIYEFLSTLEMNFRICRTPTNVRPQTLKRLLKDSAKLAIPDDLNDYQRIVDILIQKFGNPIVILSNILDLHQGVGRIPSKYCQRPPWQKIEETCKNHLFLIRKAEALAKNEVAYPQIFESSYKNFHLINLMSHEWNDDLKTLQHSSEVGHMYRLIVKRFEEILASASSNIDHTDIKYDIKPKKDNIEPRKPEVRFDMDQCALAYGYERQEPLVGACQPQDCHFCVTFQRLGTGKDYFERHLLYGQSKKHYVNNCPNYLALSMEEKNNFIRINNFCQFCLRFKSQCRNQRCGDDHLQLFQDRRKKFYVCKEEQCKTRIELCLNHKHKNRESLESRKRNLREKFQIDFTIGVFTAVNTPTTYSFNNCSGEIKTTIINDHRSNEEAIESGSDKTMPLFNEIEKWLDDERPKPINNTIQDNEPLTSEKINDLTTSIVDKPPMLNSTSENPNLTFDTSPNNHLHDEITEENLDTTTKQKTTISNEYQAYKQQHKTVPKSNYPMRQELGLLDPILFVPSYHKSKNPPLHIEKENTDKPLLVDSTTQLLNNGTRLLAENCKSIFMYSKIQGLTRPLSCLFDSGGGSSLSLNNIPGRQLQASKGNTRPVCLQGIGSGKTIGEQYTMLLPLLKGGNVGVEIFAVPEILQPMSRVDLEPALHFFKDTSKNDPRLATNTKDEIAKASIFRFVQGSLDLLLGVKLFGIFPTLVHTLSCGLSIFKMKLRPSSNKALYCLGGPYQSLSSIQAQFPDGAIMLQEFDAGLSGWRESCSNIISQGITIDYIPPDEQFDNYKQFYNDEIILGILDHKDKQDKEIEEQNVAHNRHNAEMHWQNEVNDVMLRFFKHLAVFPPIIKDLINKYDMEAKEIRWKMGYLFHRIPKHSGSTNTMDNIVFLKGAISYLDRCISPKIILKEKERPNTYIGLDIDNSFETELSTFQNFFLSSYPNLKNDMTPTKTAHITLLAFKLPDNQSLEKAGIAFTKAWNEWLTTNSCHVRGSLKINFQGVGQFNDEVLFLKPKREELLITLNTILLTTFEEFGFECDNKFTPHLTFAKLPVGSPDVFPKEIIKKFSDISIGYAEFKTIKMLSMKKNKDTLLYPCYKALTFSIDMTWPKTVAEYFLNDGEWYRNGMKKLSTDNGVPRNELSTLTTNNNASWVNIDSNTTSPISTYQHENNKKSTYSQTNISIDAQRDQPNNLHPSTKEETLSINSHNSEEKEQIPSYGTEYEHVISFNKMIGNVKELLHTPDFILTRTEILMFNEHKDSTLYEVSTHSDHKEDLDKLIKEKHNIENLTNQSCSSEKHINQECQKVIPEQEIEINDQICTANIRTPSITIEPVTIDENDPRKKHSKLFIGMRVRGEALISHLEDIYQDLDQSVPNMSRTNTIGLEAHWPYLKIGIIEAKDDRNILQCMNIFYRVVKHWLQRLTQNSGDTELLNIKFTQINCKDGILTAKPSTNMERLKNLQHEVYTAFQNEGFNCDLEYEANLNLGKIHSWNARTGLNEEINEALKTFEEVDIGSENFDQIQLLSETRKHESGYHQCYMHKHVYKENDNFPSSSPKDQIPPYNNPPDDPKIESDDQDSFSDQEVQWDPIWEALFPEICDDTSFESDNSILGCIQKDYSTLLTDLTTVLQTHDPEPRCPGCIDCKACKNLTLISTNNITSAEHREEFIIKSSVSFDHNIGKFCAPLPLKEDPATSLAPNREQAKKFYHKMVKSLNDKPEDKKAVMDSFNKLIELGFVERLMDMDEDTQKLILQKQLYVIPWNVVYKVTSVTTPCRIVLNGSSKTKTGKSLNSILCKGIPCLNLLPLILVLLSDPILLTLDLQKFFNSCLIPKYQYHLQCVWWNEDLDPKKEPEIYILKTHTYGMASSSRVLEVCLQKVAEMHSEEKDFHDLFTKKLYVDDAFANCNTPKQAEELRNTCEKILPKKGFKVKGYAESYKCPPANISEVKDGVRTIGVIGMIWIPEKDVLRFRPPTLDFTGIKCRGKLESSKIFDGNTIKELDDFVPQQITLRTVASKSASFWDPPGLAEPWFLGVKQILRLSVESVNREWDRALPSDLRSLWVEKFWEMLQLSKIDFPRCTFPIGVKYTELTIVGFSDYGNIGKVQCFYSLKRINDDQYHVQLIYSKSQLSDKLKSVPCQELDSASKSATIIDKISLAIGNVDRIAILVDSTVIAYWIMKDPLKLGIFHRKRVQNILRFCSSDNIFHVRSEWNPSDIGTKRPEPLSSIMPGSFFSTGPKFLKLGLNTCEDKSIIKRISNVILDPSLKDIALDGIAYKDMPKEYFNIDDKHKMSTSVNDIPTIRNSIDMEVQDNNIQTKDLNNLVMSFNTLFVQKVEERFDFHTYLVNPIERPWSVSVRTMSIVLNFIKRITIERINKSKTTLPVLKLNRWQILYTNLFIRPNDPTLNESFTNLCFDIMTDEETDSIKSSLLQPSSFDQQLKAINNTKMRIKNNDSFILHNHNQPLHTNDLFPNIESLKTSRESAIFYFLKLASDELGQFYSKSMIKKHAVKRGGIFYSKQRLLEVDNISNLMNEEVDTRELGIQNELPCSDRYSPTAISILMHFHRKICNHQGVDRTWLAILSSLYVFQGQTLLTEIIRSCFHCRYKLMKKFKTNFGPINKYSLTFASINKHIMLDLSGPYHIKTKFGSRPTRNNKNTTKVYLLHTICLTSFFNCIVMVEDYGSEAFTDSLHRIGSRYGYPSVAWTDGSRAQLKSLLGTTLTLNSLFGDVYQETGIEVRVSGAGSESHSRNGRIEKSINCFQMFLKNKKIEVESLSILQFDSLISQATAFLNSMPLCHKKRVGASVSSSLISPFSFLLGRKSNCRAPAGYPQLPKTRSDILEGVEKASAGMFNYFMTSVPDLLLRPDKYDESEKLIEEGDMVLFAYEDNAISKVYKLGKVTNLEIDGDNKPRIAEVQYALSQEQTLKTEHGQEVQQSTSCRYTRRGVHTLVKVYSESDPNINKDLDQLNSILKSKYVNTITDVQSENTDQDKDIHQEGETPLIPGITFALIMSQMGYLIRNQ